MNHNKGYIERLKNGVERPGIPSNMDKAVAGGARIFFPLDINMPTEIWGKECMVYYFYNSKGELEIRADSIDDKSLRDYPLRGRTKDFAYRKLDKPNSKDRYY